MSRKDAIIMAVLINMGLLAVLFATAVVQKEEPLVPSLPATPASVPMAATIPVQAKPVVAPTPSVALSPVKDEVDQALSRYVQPSSALHTLEKQPSSTVEEGSVKTATHWVEVKVKEGDALEKIARNHGTSVMAIKEANQLTNEKIRVGQVLRVPLGEKTASIQKTGIDTAQTEYYVVESGDNPWTIAKKCHVKYNDILALNQLDEEKARNLKAGDRIRIR